jgi:hypothetical protein
MAKRGGVIRAGGAYTIGLFIEVLFWLWLAPLRNAVGRFCYGALHDITAGNG